MWPKSDPASMNAYYGNPDADGNGTPDSLWEAVKLVTITPPYPMVLAWDTSKKVKSIRCHARVADSLLRCLTRIHHDVPEEIIRTHQLDRFGGCYMFRTKRGGASLSIHSWGAAIDLSPEINYFGRKYDPTKKMMPQIVVRIFEDEGWEWGGLWKKGDAMHFEATAR